MKEDRIFFRVTNMQKQQLLIHAREENLTLTDYILRHTLADEKALDDEDKNLVKELNRIGINLNQIARALNRGQNFAAEAKEVHQQIKKLDAYFKRVFNPSMSVKARPRKDDSAEVYAGDEFLGVVYVDDEDDDRSYNFSMAILDVDL